MSRRLAPAGLKALTKAAGVLSEQELLALFRLVRTRTNGPLLAAVAVPEAKGKPNKPAAKDALVGEVAGLMKPLLAPNTEKAELLLAQFNLAPAAPIGLAAAVRRLRQAHSDDAIRAGAKALMAQIAKRHGMRETVT